MSELQGANTTCFVCGCDYTSQQHLTQCLNRPIKREQDGVPIYHDSMELDDYWLWLQEMHEIEQELEDSFERINEYINQQHE